MAEIGGFGLRQQQQHRKASPPLVYAGHGTVEPGGLSSAIIVNIHAHLFPDRRSGVDLRLGLRGLEPKADDAGLV